MEIGQAVVYVDSRGQPRPALLTAVHGSDETPSVNLVYVSDDGTKGDPYGRQIERQSSVVNEKYQSAHGNYWKAA